MAAATASSTQIFNNHEASNNNNTINNSNEVSREEIQAAIAKAVELRAIHAALMMHGSATAPPPPPAAAARTFLSSSSPLSLPLSHLSAHDYPVFTPSYGDEVAADNPARSRTLSENWDEFNPEQDHGYETVTSDCNKENSSTRKGLQSNVSQAEDQKSVTGSCAHNITVLHTSPGAEFYKSGRLSSLTDFKSVSSCNRCKAATVVSESETTIKSTAKTSFVAPMTDSHSYVTQPQPKNRRMMSWLFPKLKRKHRNETSPNLAESEEVSQVFKDLGMLSIETLKRELMEANENRDAALMEVAEMKSSLGELKQKLECLEGYCLELKKALKQATQSKNLQLVEKPINFPTKRGKNMDVSRESVIPVSEDVMVEGFLQIVSEARLSVKQFCKTLIGQIEETDITLVDNLNSLLQPYKLSLNSKYSKAVLYHLEAMISQSLYQDFENCVFQKNGSPKHLDPQQERQAQFSSFAALRNLSWNEVLQKGTKYYSEEFSKFCDQKMSCIITTLNWTIPWSEQLLQAFFVAAKCIWLLHLLAFSFNPPLGILRVEENRNFDPHYMEDMFMDRRKSHGPSKVKILVMPGFYVQDRVLRCKVLCRYKSGA